jgi:hypothetical protein
MTTQRTADIVSGLVLAALGAAVIVAALDIQSVFGERLPPRTLPMGLGLTTLVTGLLLSVRAYLYRGEDLGVHWPDRDGWLRLGITIVSLVLYLFLIEPLGVALATLVFSTALIWYLDRKPIRAIVIGVSVAVVIQVVFVQFLQLPFPQGFWSQ